MALRGRRDRWLPCPPRLTPGLIAGLYVCVGCLWIVLSDRLATWLAGGDAGLLALLQTYKGWAYVIGTGVALYFMVRGSTAQLESMAAALKRLNEELEGRVRERTSQLEAANRELEAFSYSVSHDLRAPLRAMCGFTRVLLDEHAAQLPEEAKHYLERIQANAEDMGRLIQKLLDLSRLGRQPLRMQPLDLRALVEQAIGDLRPEIGDRDVRIQVGELPLCRGDPALVKQVFANLLSNAVKFSRGVPVAIIEVGACTRDGRAAVYVRDNGAGFDMRYAGKLFGVFQRLHSADEFEGSGVGLATVQRIVARHGGAVWAEGEPGRGATFGFTLGDPQHIDDASLSH